MVSRNNSPRLADQPLHSHEAAPNTTDHRQVPGCGRPGFHGTLWKHWGVGLQTSILATLLVNKEIKIHTAMSYHYTPSRRVKNNLVENEEETELSQAYLYI